VVFRSKKNIAMTKRILEREGWVPRHLQFAYVGAAWIALMAFAVNRCAAENVPAKKLIASPRALVIAHRGNSSVAPENTLAAFQSAHDARADLIELDYFHSADGVPVVIHDEVLDRTTNAKAVLGQGRLLVGDYRLAELQQLDAGSWFAPSFAGQKLPTLRESLDLIQRRSVALIERKAGDAQTLVRLLEDAKLIDHVVVQAFDWKFVAECRQLSPRLVLGTLSGKPATEEAIRAAAATGADLIVWDHRKLGSQQIALIHQLGKKAWAYTIDQPARASELIAAGLDGVITNKPAEMLKVGPAAK
jgi:glycerophosphoryl diester phosphodiesterase